MGKGSAVMTSPGYAAKHGFDAIVLLYGDGLHDPGEIPGLLEPITTSTPGALTQASTTKSLSNDAADLVLASVHSDRCHFTGGLARRCWMA